MLDEKLISSDVAGEREPPWVERSAASVLGLLGGSVSVFLKLVSRPWRAASIAADGNIGAPPLSFLIVSIVLAGLQSRAFLLYEWKTIDAGIMSQFMEAGRSWGLQEVLLLTVPVISIVVLTGMTAARWTLRTETYFGNPVLRSVCYAAGTQLIVLSLVLALIMVIQGVPFLSREVAPLVFRDDVSFVIVALMVLIPTIQIERVIAALGTTFIARQAVVRAGLSFVTATTVLCGVVSTGMVTFEFQDFYRRGVVQRELQDSVDSARCGVIASVISEEVSPTLDGDLRVEQVVMLTNITDRRWAVPRPKDLEIVRLARTDGSRSSRLPLESCSIDWEGEHGWILQPGETRLFQWTVGVPRDIHDERIAVARFYCTEVELETMVEAVYQPSEKAYAQVMVDWSAAAVLQTADAELAGAEDTVERR